MSQDEPTNERRHARRSGGRYVFRLPALSNAQLRAEYSVDFITQTMREHVVHKGKGDVFVVVSAHVAALASAYDFSKGCHDGPSLLGACYDKAK